MIRAVLVIFGILALTRDIYSATKISLCNDNGDFYRSLPSKIGKEGQSKKFVFRIECDTVLVRKGDTTIVYPGSMIYFANPTLNSIIKVEGTLLFQGSENSKVYISGSIDRTKQDIVPGKKMWGGIEISETGRLELNYADVVGALIPIDAFTRNFTWNETTFFGAYELRCPIPGHPSSKKYKYTLRPTFAPFTRPFCDWTIKTGLDSIKAINYRLGFE